MDYEKKYKEALEWMKDVYPTLQGAVKKEAEKHFPELKESEDERIRKELIHIFNLENFENYDIKNEEVIAWLEKRGEKGAKGNEVEIPNSEQKPAVIIPKFKIGDWVVYCNEDVDLITGIEENGYTINEGGYIPFVCESDIRLWTIQDAKDGDVLVASDGSIFIFKEVVNNGCKHYIALATDKVVNVNVGLKHYWETTKGVKPATKEQRDLLFQKMRDAGYEWDAEKKELKKIEQKPLFKFEVGDIMRTLQEATDNITSGLPVVVSIDEEYYHCTNELIAIKDQDDYEYPPMNRRQKPAWSEEDENIRKKIIKFLKEQNYFDGKANEFKEPYKKEYEWLKSLRPQSHWKPSEEMLEALYRVIPENVMEKSEDDMLLDELYQGLKYGKVLSEK